MARIETYGSDNFITHLDKVIGTDQDSNKATKNFEMGAIRDYVVAGIPPGEGGTFKITTITQETPLSNIETPEDFINQLEPTVVVAKYEIVFVVLSFNDSSDNNTEKKRTFVLKKVNTTIGLDEEETTSSDFLLLNEEKPSKLLKVFKEKISVSDSSSSGGVFNNSNSMLNEGFTNSIAYSTSNNLITISSLDSEFSTDKTHVLVTGGFVTSISNSSIAITINNLPTSQLIPIFISIEVYA